MDNPTHKTNPNSKTPSQVLGGKERREAVKIWQSVAESKARINLMRNLIKEGMGLAELEEFEIDLCSKFRSSKFTVNQPTSKSKKSNLVEQSMKIKLADEMAYYRESCATRTKVRRIIAKRLVNNSRPFRRAMKDLHQEEIKKKEELSNKFKEKVEHLKTKYRAKYNKNNTEDEEIPDDIVEYSNLTVLRKVAYDALEKESYEVTVIGEVNLTVEESKVLKLHPKFGVVGRLQEAEFEHEQQVALAKLRMQLTKEKEHEDMTSEEVEEDEELE